MKKNVKVITKSLYTNVTMNMIDITLTKRCINSYPGLTIPPLKTNSENMILVCMFVLINKMNFPF
jgi:hypothetical protein